MGLTCRLYGPRSDWLSLAFQAQVSAAYFSRHSSVGDVVGYLPAKPLFTLNKMRHVAALLLCVLGGNASPAVADLEKVVTSFGGEFDQEQAEKLVKELEGKNIEEVVAAGKAKIATVSVGAAPAAGAAAGGAAPAKVEEKAVEEEEEVDMGGGMDMFGGDEDY
ncbi:hypothetical protein PRIC1_002987 [Phytophthora ramorum]